MAYLLTGIDGYPCRQIEAPTQHGKGEEAELEYQEWAWVAKWDSAAVKAESLQEALIHPPEANWRAPKRPHKARAHSPKQEEKSTA